MITIVPALLVKDISSLEEEIKKVEGFTEKIQVDVIDGKFAAIETVTPEMLINIETEANIEVHLMVEEPVNWIERCVTAGVTAVYGQVEKMSDIQRFITESEEAGLGTGLAIDIGTPVSEIEDWINMVDAVLLMSVVAGAQGQEFDEKVLEKIKEVREISSFVCIVVDGGLNEANIKKCLKAGGEKMEFAVGSEILNSISPGEEIEKLRSIV
jgi:ribulose-phosphate 3-epimerase